MRRNDTDPTVVADVGAADNGAPVEGVSVLIIDARRGGLSLAALRELWSFREVLWAFLLRHIKVKYKQAAIGVAWAVVQPIATAILFAIFFGRVANVPSEGAPYGLFALCGLVAWSYFSSASATGMESLVTDQGLLRKVYFPREVLPLAAVGAGLVDLAPSLVTLAIVASVMGRPPNLAWLSIPIALMTLVLAATSLSLLMSALNVYYRDVRYALPFALQLALFASPVAYSLQSLPPRVRTIFAVVNPVASVIDAFRQAVLHASWPDSTALFGGLGVAATAVLLAYEVFKRLERSFADRA